MISHFVSIQNGTSPSSPLCLPQSSPNGVDSRLVFSGVHDPSNVRLHGRVDRVPSLLLSRSGIINHALLLGAKRVEERSGMVAMLVGFI